MRVSDLTQVLQFSSQLLLDLTILILQPEQIHVPDNVVTILEGTITAPAQRAALMNLIHNEGMMSVLTAQHFLDQYETTESLAHLDKAIEFLEKAVEHIPRNSDPDVRCSRLTRLGGAYGMRYDRTGSTHDLDRSIELITDAIRFMTDCALVSDYLDYLAASYAGLENWLSQRFKRFGSSEDLRRAVDAAEMSINLTPPDSPDWRGRMNDFGLRLGERSVHDVNKGDLDRAIKCLEMAVDAGTSLSPASSQMVRLNNLGTLLGDRFRSRGAVEDLNRSVEVLEKALKGSSPNHSMRCYFLHNLAMALVGLYEHHGTDQDLDRAIELQRTAVDQTPEGHPDGADRAGHLGLWLAKRAMKIGSTEDIACSVDAIRASIKALPKDHSARPRLLMGLGSSLHSLSRRTSSDIDLEDAIEATREAVSSIPQGHHLHTAALHNLSIALGHRAQYYPRSSGTQDCPEAQSSDPYAEAIAISRSSVDATEDGHTDRPSRLANLGDLFQQRFLRNACENMDDIDNAIKVTRQAVDISPRTSYERTGYLENLGTFLIFRYSTTWIAEDQTDALDCFKEAWTLQNAAAPSVRIKAARQAAGILGSRSNWEEAGHLLEEAVKLLPSVTPRALQHTDKQDMLKEFMGLASTAAAVALNAGKSAYDALELLELGRGVIASILTDMRGDISELKAQHPSLATAFLSLRDKLDSPPDIRASINTARDLSNWELRDRKRRETEKKFGELVKEIQSLNGFHHFCGAPGEAELKAAAGLGPIVVINVSIHRCDAFLIERDSIRVLELPDLTMDEVVQRLKTLRQSLAGHLDEMAALLEWLWTSITCPCLDALKFTSPISSAVGWPHVWWIPTGPLIHFPLHAAGRHRQGGGETVLDRVMSSYAL